MKIVVSGSDGFVGKHLVTELQKNKNNHIYPLDRKQADITKFSEVLKYLGKIKPDQVYHLAGFASGAGCDKDLIFKVNVNGTLNILKALKKTCLAGRRVGKPIRILLASTAYVYGNTPKCVSENGKIDAKSFYDKSKIEMEKKARKYLSDDIEIVITRATNHTGPGQKQGFAVPDFCEQISKVNPPAGGGDEILVGNLDAKRDLFDVRDCVRAYKIVMEKGKSGEVYNIGPGNPVTIKEVLKKLIKISKKNIKYKHDPERMRPSDIVKNCVNSKKIQRLGWKPKYDLDKTLKDILTTYKM